MVRPIPPRQLADHLREVAKLLDKHGRQALDVAPILAARGYPTSTIGDGGSRSADPTSSTERAAIHHNRWDGCDVTLAKLLRLMWTAGLEIQTLVGDIVARASDIDPLPAGTGECVACHRWCRPDGDHPHDRLRAGLCPACHQSWLGWRLRRHGARDEFLGWRRHQLAQPAEEGAPT